MDTTTGSISPLRQRMIEDMRMRKLDPHTQEGYIRAVRKFAKYLGRFPDTATVEDLRNFQLDLVDHGISPVTLNATITGLKFFFDVTVDRIDLMAKMQPVHVPRTRPVISVARRRAADRGRRKPEASDGAFCCLRDGTARQRGLGAEGGRHRQPAHDPAHRAWQGRQGSLRHALAGPARAPAHVVESRPSAGQDARWRLAVPRHEPDRIAQHPPTQPDRPCRSRSRKDRQAHLDAHAETLFRVPDYAESKQLRCWRRAIRGNFVGVVQRSPSYSSLRKASSWSSGR